jgi:hypothetical protein
LINGEGWTAGPFLFSGAYGHFDGIGSWTVDNEKSTYVKNAAIDYQVEKDGKILTKDKKEKIAVIDLKGICLGDFQIWFYLVCLILQQDGDLS